MAWIDRLFAARDRLVASPRFQRWAASFPLARPIAQRRMRALFDLTAGFVYSQVLYACIELRVLDILAERPLETDALARRLSLEADSTERLLKAASALGLASKRGQRWALGMDGAALLGNPGAIAMIRHHALLYRDLADPVALLRGERASTNLGLFWPYASHDENAARASDEAVKAYSALMADSQQFVRDDICDAYDFSRHRRLLDIGGGEGVFACAVARHAPSLDLVVFDLPAVASRATARFEAGGISNRAVAVGGDIWRDPLPTGADVATLVRVLHDHDDDHALALLIKIRAALAPRGTLVIAEPMSDGRDGQRAGDAYFGFYLLAMGSGRARTSREIMNLLTAAGFVQAKRRSMRRPLLTGMVTAHRN